MNNRNAVCCQVPISVLNSIAQELEHQGIGRDVWLHGSEVSSAMLNDPNASLSAATHLRLIEHAMTLSNCPHLGLLVGHRQTPSSWGVLGYAINCCTTVRDALLMGARYNRLASTFNRFELHEHGTTASWVATPLMDFGDSLRFIMEFEFASFCRAAALLVGDTQPLLELNFSYAAPAHAGLYAAYMGVPVRFAAPHNQAVLRSSGLTLPILQGSPLNMVHAARLCEEQLSRQTLHDDLESQIRSILLAALPEACPNADEVARTLHMTARTLRNRLAERGTHFQLILDQLREQMACTELSRTRTKVEHIAWRVGFQDAPSFRRAFKRWTGLTPHEYRQRAQASGQ